MNIIIAGSRDFKDYDFMENTLLCNQPTKSYVIQGLPRGEVLTIISGTATGADRLGEIWADKHNFEVERFPADWERFGKKAGAIRNRQMAEHADLCIVFWDGQSRGTLNMIQTARDVGIPVHVYIYPKENDLC